MLIGEKVCLTTLDPANAEIVRGWVNDPEIRRWNLTGHVPVSARVEADFYTRAESAAADRSGFRFEIHLAKDHRHVGNCSLDHVDLLHRNAEVGILIGQVSDHNKGYGRDAIRTLLRFGFDTLGLHRIEIAHMAPNENAAHLYRSIGFTEVGLLRHLAFLNGEWVDLSILDMLDVEWRKMA